jgi:hypothetical protein
MTSLCLSRSEIAELTRSRHKAKQVGFLIRNGVRHYTDDHGWPVVTRSALEGGQQSAQDLRPKWKPKKAA